MCTNLCTDSAGQTGTSETEKAQGCFAPQVYQDQRDGQTVHAGRDTRRMAHNPEVGVQIPPRYQVCRSEASSDHGRGLLRVPCAPNCARGLCGPLRRLDGEAYPPGRRSRRRRRNRAGRLDGQRMPRPRDRRCGSLVRSRLCSPSRAGQSRAASPPSTGPMPRPQQVGTQALEPTEEPSQLG